MPVCDDQGEIVKQNRFLQQLAKNSKLGYLVMAILMAWKFFIAYRSYIYSTTRMSLLLLA